MYVGPVRRKKINLWLLILIILFIVAIVFTIIHMMNSTNANSDSRYNQRNAYSSSEVNKEYSGSRIGKVDSYDSFSNIESESSTNQVEMYNHIPEETTEPNSAPITLNEHTYNFKDVGIASLQGTNPNQYVELKKGNFLYKISTEKNNFSDTLHKDNLKSYLENTYNIQITSELKTGTVNNTQIIICTMADNSSVGYLIIAPLNDAETIFLKVFDANNLFALIQDLSEPINDMGIIKTNIQ